MTETDFIWYSISQFKVKHRPLCVHALDTNSSSVDVAYEIICKITVLSKALIPLQNISEHRISPFRTRTYLL